MYVIYIYMCVYYGVLGFSDGEVSRGAIVDLIPERVRTRTVTDILHKSASVCLVLTRRVHVGI